MQRRGYEPLNAPSNGFIMIMEPNLMNNTANIYFIVQQQQLKSCEIVFQKDFDPSVSCGTHCTGKL